MSYTRTYTGSVHYSGSQSYSYPASQNGGSGTVHYSGSVPVSISLHVDTSPFDNSVQSCSNSVRQLNGAVIAMNSAQVASIHQSANKVSEHIVTGFFNMISSELSQNMAALISKFKAVYELIATHASILEKNQIIMQDDYARISDRYSQIFSNLDEELEKRIRSLDKNVFEISKRVQGEQLHDQTSNKVTQFLIGVNEDEIVQQQLIIANAKAKVTKAMEEMAQNVIQESVYSKKIASILYNQQSQPNIQNYIPVVFTESSNLYSDTTDYECFSNLFSNNSPKIQDTVKNYFITKNVDLTTRDEIENKKINDAFSMIAEQAFQDLTDEKSIRIYETLKKLKEN